MMVMTSTRSPMIGGGLEAPGIHVDELEDRQRLRAADAEQGDQADDRDRRGEDLQADHDHGRGDQRQDHPPERVDTARHR